MANNAPDTKNDKKTEEVKVPKAEKSHDKTAATPAASATTTHAAPAQEAVRIRLSDIHADHEWNARSGGWRELRAPEPPKEGEAPAAVADDGEEHVITLDELAADIAKNGQDTPIIVRKNPNKNSKQPYAAIAGFRRYEAMSLNAKKNVVVPGWVNGEPSILATVKEVDEIGAQALNLRENVQRNGISPADKAWRIAQLMADHKRLRGGDLSQAAIAEMTGIPFGYVSRLVRIWQGQTDEMNRQWRTYRAGERSVARGGDPISVHDRAEKVCKQPKGSKEQQAVYDELIAKKVSGTTPTANPNAWLEGSERQAARLGFFLGRLVREKALSLMKPTFTTRFVKELCRASNGMFSVHGAADSGATDKQWETLAAACERGWNEGHAADPVPEAPKAKESKAADAPKATDAAPKASANGSTAAVASAKA